MAINYAEGWQKKNVSESLSDQRRVMTEKDGRLAAQTIEKAHASQLTEKSAGAQAASVADHKVTQKSGSDVRETATKPRVETQTEAARQEGAASEQFLKARQDSKTLSQLENRLPVARSGDDAATQAAVTQKGETANTNPGKQAPQQAAMLVPQAACEAATAKQQAAVKSAATKKSSGTSLDDDGAKKPAAEEKRQVGEARPQTAEGAKPVTTKGEVASAPEKSGSADADVKKSSEKKKGGESKDAGGVYARPTNSGGELNALLGGFAGGGGGEGGESGKGTAAAAVADVKSTSSKAELPETDPHFHVYSEFDETKPGIETVKSKAQLFNKFVEKRLTEIANFDRELDGKIRSLSDRIVGDLKDELKTADFHRSVYGGLIG
ncbi:MAG: hypothetical protein V2A66_03230 [Pseudomonadota bacterium]